MFTRQETLIQLNSVNKYYRTGYGRVHALRDAGFAVRRGEALAIIGSSGSGKSTLLHILGCLDTDYQGDYLLDGVRVRGLSRKKLADIRSRKIGFIFQKYNLVPELSVYENVELPLIYQKIPKAERAERTERVIKLVGLEDKKRVRPNQLSGGQQQRVSIARALAAGPDILLADEPTGALDSATGKEIMDLLLKLNGMGMTLAVVTHDPAIAARMPRIVRISDGRIIEDRTTDRPEEEKVLPEEDSVQPAEDSDQLEEDSAQTAEDSDQPAGEPACPMEEPAQPEEDSVQPEEDSAQPAEEPVLPEEVPFRPDVNPALRDGIRALPVWFHYPEPLPDRDELPENRSAHSCQPSPVFTSIYDFGKELGNVENHDSFF